MIRTGVIVEADLDAGRCRVQTGGNITDWLQWLTIRARSADFRGTLNSRREESWHDKTLGDIVAAIAARNKLTASVTPALAGIHIPHIDQTQESDAKFLTRLADRNGGEVSVKAGKLLFLRAGNATTASGRPIPQVTITRRDGDRHQFAIADRALTPALRLSGCTPKTRSRKK